MSISPQMVVQKTTSMKVKTRIVMAIAMKLVPMKKLSMTYLFLSITMVKDQFHRPEIEVAM